MPPPIGPKPAASIPPPAPAPSGAGAAAASAAVPAPATPTPAGAGAPTPAPMPPLQQPSAPLVVARPLVAMMAFGPAPKASLGVGPRRTPTAAEERVNAAIREAMRAPKAEPTPESGFKLPPALSIFGGNPVGDTAVSIGISGKLEADMTPRAVTAAVGGSIPGIGGVGINKTLPDPVLERSAPVEVKKEDPTPPPAPAKK